jgi:hypothetical protein
VESVLPNYSSLIELDFLFFVVFWESLTFCFQFSIASQEPLNRTRSLTVSDFMDDLKSDTTNPALEKTLSEAADVAGIPNTSLAIELRNGNC